ncbi:MAG: four helix bundle protein [Chlorobi bacterium]|nr:four helix bundle protein [Bacteroidales bacterium]NOZ36380.1 four helix bundle protein [Chlorobiota bacterium]
MHNLKELSIWNKAIILTIEVYEAVSNFPIDERFGLTSQIKRSAVSIPSNIAEGAGRNNVKEFIHFLGISNGSSFELQTQIILANKLNLMNKETSNSILNKIDEVQKMTYGLIKKLRNN